MNGHLSSEAMEQALAGRADAQMVSHLEACAACAQELTTLLRVLGAVRESAVATAEREQRKAATPRQRVVAKRWQGWALGACAVVMLAVGVPVERRYHAAPAVSSDTGVTPVQDAQNTSAPISDEALLNDVQSDLSTSVPQPLAPLTIASSSSTSSSAQSTN